MQQRSGKRAKRALCRALLAMSCALAPHGAAFAQPEALDREAARSSLDRAMQKGDYELARQIASRRDDAPAMLVRSELARRAGDLNKAYDSALAAEKVALSERDKERAVVTLAQIEDQRGDWEAAVTRLRAELKRQPEAHQARLELGKILHLRGEVREAEQLLDRFGDLFNNGLLKTSREIGYVAESMQLLGNFQDANYAFEEAYKSDQRDADLLAKWGALYLEKYNVADAQRTFEEALAINPNHLEALLGVTSLSTQRMSDLENTEGLLARLTELAPGEPDVAVLEGYVALRDGDAEGAREALQRALTLAPDHLDAIALLAAHALQQREPERYRERRARLLEISPKSASALTHVADFVANTRMEHDEALEIYRDALSVEPDHAGALMGIGFVLSRTNHDDEALDYFQRAFDLDPYNQRVYFVLEVYDSMMPQYSFKEYERFKLRAKNSEFEVVDMFAAPVIEQAMTFYDQRYDFKPSQNLAVELYPDATTFSVRSLGVPFVSAHGLCFGPLVTMHSPSEGNFNWRMVLWHEMAHVYHVQLSQARVPRWFTEGLAEYETNVHDASWRRYYDKDIATMLARGEVPTVLDLSKGFTHTNSQADVVRAYHLASLSIHFIVQQWGFESIKAMLKAWGEGLETEQVLASALKVAPQEFDAAFLTWLQGYLVDYRGQLSSDFEQIASVAELERQLKLNRRNARAYIELAVHAMRAGDAAGAEQQLERALNVAPRDPEVNHTALFIRMALGQPREAIEHGELVLDAFKDSYALRLYLGRATLMMESIEEARVHLLSAVQLDPNGQEAWAELMGLARTTSDEPLYQRAARRLYELSPHDPLLAQEQYTLSREQDNAARSSEALDRWQDINPFDSRIHRERIALLGRSGAKSSSAEEANAELERAYRALIKLNPSERAELYAEALATFERRGMKRAIETLRARAKDDGVDL